MAGFNPNVGLSPVAAYALMPTRNFQNERQNQLMAIQFQQLQNQYLDQQIADKTSARVEVEDALDAVDKQALLPLSQQHLNKTFTQKWRDKVYSELDADYASDWGRYRRERLPFVKRELNRELTQSPDFQNAVTSKANYALAKEAQAKGRVLVGDLDAKLAKFVATGGAGVLEGQEAYEPPKVPILSKLQDTYHNLYPEGVPVKGPDGKTSIRPVAISAQTAMDAAMEAGLSQPAAMDWLQKSGFQEGKYFYKVKQQDSWDAQKEATNNAQWQYEQNYKRQQDAIDNARQAAELRLRQQKAKDDHAAAKNEQAGWGGVGVGTLVSNYDAMLASGGKSREVVSPTATNGSVRGTLGVYETAGVVGKASEAALKLAGINKVDIIDKDKGKVTSVYKGTFPKLYAPDFKSTYASKAVDGSGETKLFNVQQNSVFWLDSPDGGAKRPFIKAQIAKDGKLDDNGAPAEPLDVYVPMANSSSAIASVNSEYSINESKIKAAQTNIDTQLRTQVETTYKVQRQRSSRTRHGF